MPIVTWRSSGKGALGVTEVLKRLGMKSLARVGQLSAEEAICLTPKKERDADEARQAELEVELARRIAKVAGKDLAELPALQAERNEFATHSILPAAFAPSQVLWNRSILPLIETTNGWRVAEGVEYRSHNCSGSCQRFESWLKAGPL